MSDTLTIGQLSTTASVPDSTIRYYERVGLLRPAGRTAGNYRYYDGEAASRLAFIRAAQASGFSLGDVKALLEFQDGRVNPCDQVKRLIEERLEDVNRQMKSLRQVQRALTGFRNTCERAQDDCPVLEDLAAPQRKRRRRKR